jgi:hypothetical protein
VKTEALIKKTEKVVCVWLEDVSMKWLSVRRALVMDEAISVMAILKTLIEVQGYGSQVYPFS